jgi:hypothetical protein
MPRNQVEATANKWFAKARHAALELLQGDMQSPDGFLRWEDHPALNEPWLTLWDEPKGDAVLTVSARESSQAEGMPLNTPPSSTPTQFAQLGNVLHKTWRAIAQCGPELSYRHEFVRMSKHAECCRCFCGRRDCGNSSSSARGEDHPPR